MHFNHVYITAEGYALLGSATAGSSPGQSNPSKIIWENAITSSVVTADKSVSWINSATSSNFPTSSYTGSGSVLSAVHNQQNATVDDGQGGTTTIKADVVTVTLEINNNSYSGSADTLCVFGRLEGSSAKKLIVVASTDNPETIHPKTSQPYSAIIDLHIELSGTAVSEVSAGNSWYASANAFNKLAGRVVTTHSEVSDTTGEDQDVYGVKTFKDNTVHSGNILPSADNTYSLGSVGGTWKSIYAGAQDNGRYIVIGDDLSIPNTYPLIVPSVNEEGYIGYSSRRFTAVHTKSLGSSNKYVNNAYINTIYAQSLGTISAPITDAHITNVHGFADNAHQSASSYALNILNNDSAAAAIALQPDKTKDYFFFATSTESGYTFDLGSTSRKWNTLYTNVISQSVFECTTAKATKAKTITANNINLIAGSRIIVKFTNGNTHTSPTLTISSIAGAKNINSLRDDLPVNSVVTLTYNGTSWDTEGINSSAVNLKSAPSLSFTNASSGTDGSTLTVSAGSKTSNVATITTVRQSYRPYVESTSSSNDYYIILGGSISGGGSFSSGFKNLHADSVNSFYYNPSSNRLTVPNISATTSINAQSLNVLGYVNLKFLTLYIKNPTSYTLYIRSDSYSQHGTGSEDYSLLGYDTVSGSGNSWYCQVTRYCAIGSDSNFNLSAMGGYITAISNIATFKTLTMIKLAPNTTTWYPAIILSKI